MSKEGRWGGGPTFGKKEKQNRGERSGQRGQGDMPICGK